MVSSASALISAVDNGNSPGKATCVRAGTYSVHSLDGHHSTMTTIEAYPGDQRPVLSGSIGLGGSNLRIEGFTTTGGFYTNGATDVKVVGNLFENCTACGSLLFVNSDHDGGSITVAHNLMYNVKQTGAFNDGYGVYGCNGSWSGLYILFNTFDTMNQHPVQLGGCKGVQIVGNEMRNVTYDMAPATGGDNYGEHVDCIEMWNQSTQMLIANNRCENTAPPGGQGMLLSGDTTYGTLRNNLIVDISDQCVDDTPNETSSSSFNNWTVESNTVEACGYSFNGGGLGGSYGFDMSGPNSSATCSSTTSSPAGRRTAHAASSASKTATPSGTANCPTPRAPTTAGSVRGSPITTTGGRSTSPATGAITRRAWDISATPRDAGRPAPGVT